MARLVYGYPRHSRKILLRACRQIPFGPLFRPFCTVLRLSFSRIFHIRFESQTRPAQNGRKIDPKRICLPALRPGLAFSPTPRPARMHVAAASFFVQAARVRKYLRRRRYVAAKAKSREEKPRPKRFSVFENCAYAFSARRVPCRAACGCVYPSPMCQRTGICSVGRCVLNNG